MNQGFTLMAKFEKKIKAIVLRKQGTSVKDIAQLLSISKGTASLWCWSIQLTKAQHLKLYKKMVRAGHKSRMIGAHKQKKDRLEKIQRHKEQGRKEVGSITNRDLFMIGIGLYMGEGGKTNARFEISNADHKIIALTIKWLKTFGVENKDLVGGITINHIYRSEEKKIQLEWIRPIKIPRKNLRKTAFIKSKREKVYLQRGEYRGVFALRVKKSSDLLYRILGLINAVMYK